MISFWITGTSSRGISTPMSPRAIIIPSATSIILSILSTPCWFSIFAIMFKSRPPLSSRILRISSTSSAVLVKEAAIKSNSSWIPKRISSLSFWLIKGIFTFTPGRLIPFLLETTPPLITVQWISEPTISSTSSPIRPSSIRILSPGFTSL